jgi:hypothetical protein
MELHPGVLNMRILIDVVDPLCVEHAAAALNTVYRVPFFEQELCKVRTVLTSDTSDQGDFSRRCV